MPRFYENRFTHSKFIVTHPKYAGQTIQTVKLKPVSYTHLDVYKRQHTHTQLIQILTFYIPFKGKKSRKKGTKILKGDNSLLKKCGNSWKEKSSLGPDGLLNTISDGLVL